MGLMDDHSMMSFYGSQKAPSGMGGGACKAGGAFGVIGEGHPKDEEERTK